MPWHLAGEGRGGRARGWRLRKASDRAREGPSPMSCKGTSAGPALRCRPLRRGRRGSAAAPGSKGHTGTGDVAERDIPPHPWPLQHAALARHRFFHQVTASSGAFTLSPQR